MMAHLAEKGPVQMVVSSAAKQKLCFDQGTQSFCIHVSTCNPKYSKISLLSYLQQIFLKSPRLYIDEDKVG